MHKSGPLQLKVKGERGKQVCGCPQVLREDKPSAMEVNSQNTHIGVRY